MANSILYKLSEARTYFIRGHGQWLTYPISIINFISISFYLLIDNLTIIPEEFKLLRYFIETNINVTYFTNIFFFQNLTFSIK